jgi:large subunit ribosomal protein L16
MLQPSKTKYRKQQKGRIRGISYKGSELKFGSFGIKALECGMISSKQIETIRILISRILGKTGKMWIRIFPDKVVTRKAAGVRMGSGKGDPEFWAARIRAGIILFEVDGVDMNSIKEVSKVIDDKLQIKTKFVVNRELGI